MARAATRFAELLAAKARREKRKITQRDVAEETGLNLRTVNKYMRDDVKEYGAKTLGVLCKYLEKPVSELLILEPTEPGEEVPESSAATSANGEYDLNAA